MPPAPSASTPDDDKTELLAQRLARVALGDRQAFEAVYRSTSGALLATIARVVGDRRQAEDVLQEVYVTVWRSAGGYQPAAGRPMTWLMSIARNRAIDSLRKRGREPQVVSRYAASDDDPAAEVDLLAQVPDTAPGPLALLEQASAAHALEHCMDGLVERQRASLALAYYDGLSHAEVAEQMAEPLGTIKSWIRRGLQSLRACLDRATRAPSQQAGVR